MARMGIWSRRMPCTTLPSLHENMRHSYHLGWARTPLHSRERLSKSSSTFSVYCSEQLQLQGTTLYDLRNLRRWSDFFSVQMWPVKHCIFETLICLLNLINNASAWAVAGANTYRAYGGSQWHDLAVAVWNQINDRCLITAADSSVGTHPTKNVTFPSQCNDGRLLIRETLVPNLLSP